MKGARAVAGWITALAVVGCDAGQTSTTDGGIDPDQVPNQEPGTPAPDGYYVHYNQVFYQDGRRHRFIGMSRPSLEWSATGQYLSASDYTAMASWGANVVRLPMNQVFWLSSSSYAQVVDQQIAWAKAAGLDVILDLHWNDGDGTSDAGQQEMADQNSLVFWEQVARRYQSDGRVLFELYNEPHTVGWDVWRDGGASATPYQAAGMQQMYDVIRGAGAHNLVVVGGLDYAYNLAGVRVKALDGYNVLYASHPYDFRAKLSDDWDRAFGDIAELHPVILTEFGTTDNGISMGSCSATDYYAQVIDYANARGISWVAWAWWAGGCAFPSLVTDLGGTPSQAGAVVRDRMLQTVP